MRRIAVALILFLAAAFSIAEEADWKTRLAVAIERAVAHNPSIAEQESRIEASRQRVGQATALPDPEVELGVQDVQISPLSFTSSDFTMAKITARQRIPAAGKRPAQEKSAEAELAAAAALHLDHAIRLAAEVADTFFALAEADARTRLIEVSRDRLERVASDAAERYRVGRGAQADVLRANLDVTAAQQRLVGLHGLRRMLEARFNALQALSPGTSVEPFEVPEPDPVAPRLEDLLNDAEARSPGVAAASAEIRRAEEQVALARLERRPDFTPMAYYAYRADYPDFFGASVSLNLPFFQPKRLSEREAEKEADLSAARANAEVVRNEIQRDIGEAYADLERSLEETGLYRTAILPQSETSLRAAQEGYTVGQVDFSTYVRAALDRDAYETDFVTRRAGAWRAMAALQRASGLPLIPGTPQAGDIHVQN
jgi:outer membrane protein TolC